MIWFLKRNNLSLLVKKIRALIPNRFVNLFFHLPFSILAVIFYRYPARKLKIIGVTGTDGKTTTATLIYEILRKSGKKVALITTVSAKIGEKDLPTGLHVTTPNPWELQKLIRLISDKGFEYLVLEVTSHGLAQFRTFGCNFLIGVITNVTNEHLDYHHTWKKYLLAKAKLFYRVKYKILNKDDKSFSFLKRIGKGNLITYSLKKNAFIKAINIKFRKNFSQFEYKYLDIMQLSKKLKTIKIITPLIGDYNIYNCLAAIAAAKTLGIANKNIQKAIKNFKGITGRMEFIRNKRGFKIIVDFAHTPNALRKALKVIKQVYKPKRMIAVFGCAGLRDKKKRPKMGEAACLLADYVVLTAEDPRTEEVNMIIKEISKGCQKKEKIFKKPDRLEAIDFAINKLAKKGDIVGIFGKGHEQSMCFGTTEYPWSDKEAVLKTLKKGV